MTLAPLIRFMTSFVRDESAMSRIDCAVIHLILIAGVASGIYAYNNFAAQNQGPATGAPPGSGQSADTATTIFGLPLTSVLYGVMVLWALVVVVRLIKELRD